MKILIFEEASKVLLYFVNHMLRPGLRQHPQHPQKSQKISIPEIFQDYLVIWSHYLGTYPVMTRAPPRARPRAPVRGAAAHAPVLRIRAARTRQGCWPCTADH
jgi:hypothetical protein